jgi:hypothetical protein
MLSLAEHQHAMLDLLKGRRRPPGDDAYLARIDRSPELDLLREVAVFWRMLAIESGCPWLAQLLKRRGILEREVEAFYRAEDVSPYAERATEQFVRLQQASLDPLTAQMAATEAALIRVRQGDAQLFALDWDRNPNDVFAALGTGADLPPREEGCLYRLHIARDLSGLVRCERIAA